MRIEEPDFWIEISKEKASEIVKEMQNNKYYFINIFDFEYIVNGINKIYNNNSLDNARYFLNLKGFNLKQGVYKWK